jgi:hypothetical protein
MKLLIFVAMTVAASAETFHGVITDTMCGKKHEMMKGQPDDQCIKACVKGSSDLALFDGEKIWKLSDQKKSAVFAAKRVVVTGTLDQKSKTIKVTAIDAE